MAKTESTAMSFRLRDDARFILEQRSDDWGISKTAVIERLLMATEIPSDVGAKDWTQGRNTIERAEMLIAQTDPAKIDGISTGPPKNAYCVHCEQKFAGPKGSNICAPCGRDGHVSSGDCRRCVQVKRAKELATSTTAVEGVDYDWQEPI